MGMVTSKTDWEIAIENMPAKGYRERNGNYETFVSVNSKTISLGSYSIIEDAQTAIRNFRIKRFLDGIHLYNLNENDCLVTHEKYVVFNSGEIFNLFGKKMIGQVDKAGYQEVILNGKQYRVHRIVAQAFISNEENKPCVNHIDGNKLNNNINNLEWVTYSENTKHAYKTGLEKKSLGENHHAHKLTINNVKYIRHFYKKGDKQYGATALASQFGVDRTTIENIIRFKTWRNLHD